MKVYKNGTVAYDGADIAAAFGMPNPYTKCESCGHKRNDHERHIDQPERARKEGMFPGRKDTYEKCGHWDLRRTRTNGTCPCPMFVEPKETTDGK